MADAFRLVAVAAMDEGRVIGRAGELPWHLPEDLRLFKELTAGHAIVMGRNTFESIGRPLPRRRNLVLSRTMQPAPGIEVLRSPDQLGSAGLSGEVFVIGGEQIYATLLPRCDELILTLVHGHHEGDTRFPPFEDDFELVEVLDRHEQFERRRYRRRDCAQRLK